MTAPAGPIATSNGGSTSVVDVHAHAMPLPLLQQLERMGLADLSGAANSVVTLDPAVAGLPSGSPIPYPPEQYDLQARLAAMDAARIDLALLSAPPFLFCTTTEDEKLVVDVVQRSNDALIEFSHKASDRFLMLATLPIGTSHALNEARRCIEQLGCAGVTIGTYGLGKELDDPANEEVWQYLAERRAFVFLHPSRVSSSERLTQYHLPQLLGYPAETALATSRLVFSGVLERHALSLCLAHGGGCLQSVAARLDLGWRRKPVAQTVSEPPTSYLKRLYFDTAVFDATALARLIEDVGADRVLLGTDAPFDLEERDPLQLLDEAGVSGEELRLIAGGNALRLLHPSADSMTADGPAKRSAGSQMSGRTVR